MSTESRKIVISGITGSRNRGVEALSTTVVAGINRVLPSADVTLLTDDAAFDSDRFNGTPVRVHGIGEKSMRAWRRHLMSSWPLGRVMTPNLYLQSRKLDAIISESDLLIVSGGDIFSSDYGDMSRHLSTVRRAIDANLPVVFHAHSVGVFNTPLEAKAWIEIARRCRIVSLRESASMAYVRDELGYRGDNIESCADPAFLLEPASSEFIERCWRTYGIEDDGRPIVAVGASQGVSAFADADKGAHLALWLRIIDALVERLDARVILVPHVQERWVNYDDRVLATNIALKCKHPESVRLIGGDHTAGEFKALIAASDLVIAERMHACIAGLSSCTPTLSIGYSIKSRGIMKDLLGDDAEELGAVVPLTRLMEADEPEQIPLRLFENAGVVRDRLQQSIPAQKESAARGFDRIAESLA